jgi:hypothetical protein
VILAFLSRRLRAWLLFAVLLPVVGRLLELVGVSVRDRNERVSDVLTKAGGYARTARPGQLLRRH